MSADHVHTYIVIPGNPNGREVCACGYATELVRAVVSVTAVIPQTRRLPTPIVCEDQPHGSRATQAIDHAADHCSACEQTSDELFAEWLAQRDTAQDHSEEDGW